MIEHMWIFRSDESDDEQIGVLYNEYHGSFYIQGSSDPSFFTRTFNAIQVHNTEKRSLFNFKFF